MSKFVVSARKYRPKTFDEVVGQQHVSDTLKKALQSSKVAHAYLFCGPRGVGKTTCARILAKVVNCENPTDKHTPCGVCSSCQSFEDNGSFNILELDAASNNSVENIRSLIDQVRIQPQSGKYKIFIIDEVHMLSQSAFNAFLKTLEEPPPYVIFIMATTEKHKILPTILSRCQIYDFKRIQPSDIVPQLQYILEKENKTADFEALHIIGQKADGAMRDALSIFDRIASSTGSHISYKDVVENLNMLDYDYFFRVTDNLILERLGDVLLDLDDVMHKGFEADQFMHGLAEHFRNLLMLSIPETIKLLDVGEALKSRYLEQANLLRRATLMSFLNIANECDIHYPMARNKRLHVEVALSKMTYASRLIQSADTSLEEKKTKLANDSSDSQAIDSSSSKTELTTESKKIDQAPSKENKKTHSQLESADSEALKQPEAKKEESVVDENPLSESLLGQAKEGNEEPKSQLDISKSPKKALNKIAAMGDMPILSSNMFDSLEEKIRKEEKLNESSIPINKETVSEVVRQYADQHDSNSIQQILKMMDIEADSDAITFYVPSVIAKESVSQQSILMDLLREKFSRRDIAIPVVIDKDRFPDYVAPVIQAKLTDREKYVQMIEKNPNLSSLQDKFNLEPN